MDPVENPYSPGAGRKPHALVGRDVERGAFAALVERAKRGTTDRGIMLSGLRGVGKTVLLNDMASQARNAGWVIAQAEAQPGAAGTDRFSIDLARQLNSSLRSMISRGWTDRLRRAAATFKAFTLKLDPTGALSVGIEVDPVRGRADTGRLEIDLQELASDLSAAAIEQRTGIGVFIDEIQDLHIDVLAALCSTSHWVSQRDLPFYIVGAGLPHLPRVLGDARSYAERLFNYRSIDPLGQVAARQALVGPAHAHGCSWDPTAADIVLAAAAGYPYFLQEYGRAAWDVAVGPVISELDADLALQEGREHLDRGFFRSRWERATNAERALLTAMAADRGVPSSSSEVASRLGKASSAIGPARAGLIGKGLVYAPDHGLLAYTVPGMADFIARQT